VAIGGAKNSVLKLMAASLLAEGSYELHNVPAIADVCTMADLLGALGARVDRPAPGVLRIETPGELVPEAPYELVERIRASILVLGPLLARCRRARVSMPGGDDFGARPIDMHLSGLEALGATFELRSGYLEGTVERLAGATVSLPFPSVGATENIVMAAVAARGSTVLENAAREPEIVDLCRFLTSMGARIEGAGTPTITVHGVEVHELAPPAHPHPVVADRVEAATYVAAAGVTGGEIELLGVNPATMGMLLRKCSDMGIVVSETAFGVAVKAPERLSSVDVQTLPYPGVATDYKPLITAMLATADGVGVVTENLFAGRFRYVEELVRMGADIRTDSHHAVVRGVPRLSGAPVRAHDIRAGASLVVAGLAAEGETVVADAHHLDRGYEELVTKLTGLGADVARG
jgi:UDP-N-acetylglucosamine 1-carboxyvinyltransferase